jgi:hypothetical protein
MVGDQLAQAFQAEVGEGHRLLVASAVDPEAAVLGSRLSITAPQKGPLRLHVSHYLSGEFKADFARV